MEESKLQFIQLINNNQRIITNLCQLYYTNRLDQEDMRQSIILQLWKSFPGFKNLSKETTWVYRIAINTILQEKRKKKIQYCPKGLESHMGLHRITADDDIQLLKQLINLLSDQDKALLILFLEGYKYSEISKMLQLSYTNVTSRISRIKKSLRKKYYSIN